MDNAETQRDRLIQFIESKGMSRRAFQETIDVSISYVHNMSGNIRPNILRKINEVYPELNIRWLRTGKGNMIQRSKASQQRTIEDVTVSNNDSGNIDVLVPLLPISAQAGKLSEFSEGIDESSCEMMVSPIKDAEIAVTITGDSMSPDYPNGSVLLIKKINDTAFIEWGRTYVLDTVNGAVIKNIFPSENEDLLKCVSINTLYPPFEVSRSDVFGIYRVLMCLSLK